MTGSVMVRPRRRSLFLVAAALALAGCSTLGGAPSAEKEDPALTTLQPNLTSLSEVITQHPADPQAYNMRGSVYGESGRSDLALADFSKAISIDPNYAPAYVGRGIVYSQQGKSEQALADLNKAIALKPDNAEAYYSRGLLYQTLHQNQSAVDDFTAG